MHDDRALQRRFGLRGSVKFENHANTLSPEQEGEGGIQSQSSRPRADQFCVYNTGEESCTAAFVIEYKAPHKLPLGYIYEGLNDMDLDKQLLD